MKTLLTGGMVVTEERTVKADVLLTGEVIASVGNELSSENARVIDISGKYALPGGVDVHTHMSLDLDAANPDAFYQGTIPAVMGGTTSIVDHLAFAPRGRSLREHIALYRRLCEGQPVVDYGLHGLAQHMDAETEAGLIELPAQGCASVKAYMTYDGRLDDAELLQLLRLTKEHGLLAAVHAENHEQLTRLRAEFKSQGKGAPLWHARSRPPECEAEAVGRLLRLAAEAGDAPIYIVHLSTRQGLERIRQARAQGQRHIHAETCLQYLLLTEAAYLDPVEGLNAIMSPPLRTKEDVDALWQGLRAGDIDTVATDHCFFTRRDKQRGLHDFTLCPGGAPGIEERMVMLFSEGVVKGRISLERFVAVTATAPARLFGLYPRKGAIQTGADADIVILDPAPTYVLHRKNMHGPGDYSVYEGMAVQGTISHVFLRGTLMAEHGVFTGRRGAGRFNPAGLGAV